LPELTPFENRDVASIAIIVRNTGDGLSEAVAVDPVELHVGDEVTVAMRCVVEKIRFDPIKDTDALRRVQILKAGEATFLESETVNSALDEQLQRIEASKGVQRLPLDGEDEDELGDDEDQGDGAFDPSAHPAPAALAAVKA